MIPCVGWAPVKSPAPFDVTVCNVDTQGGYQPQQNGVSPRVCPNADTEQAARASASDGPEAYSCLILCADNEDDYGSKKYWSKGGQSGPKGGHIRCSPLTPNIAINSARMALSYFLKETTGLLPSDRPRPLPNLGESCVA